MFESGLNTGEDDDGEPEWMLEHARQQKRNAAMSRQADLESRLERIREKENRAKSRFEAGEPPSKRQVKQSPLRAYQRLTTQEKTARSNLTEPTEDSFALEDYESEDERPKTTVGTSSLVGLSVETQALMEKLGMLASPANEDEETEVEDELKIFYCSRTHSQLTQFVNELRRVKMPPAIAEILPERTSKPEQGAPIEQFKHLTLGSRKALCINPKVAKLGNATAVNERCLELQQSGMPSEAKCPYLPTKDNEVLMNDFRDHALAKVRDIEDFGVLGKKLGICPYYATRATVRPSEIVTLPYPLLLQKSARDALGLSLKGHVVIIDEAHNLMDTISSIHSVSVTLNQLKQARSQLGIYLQKFRNRLKGKNRVYVTQLVRLIDSLSTHMQAKFGDTGEATREVPIEDLMTGKGVDQINMYKLMRYLQESKLARKVDGYVALENKKEEEAAATAKRSDGRAKRSSTGSLPVLTHIHGFLLALTYPAAEGRFFCTATANDVNGSDVTLKYMLLDPTQHFRDIVDEARAVVLIGGTMSPV